MPTTYTGTAASLNGTVITNFAIGDQIDITDETPTAANVHISGNMLDYTGGSITIDNLGPGRYVIREIGTTGTDIRLQQDAHNDFNGDGHSDILWRSSTGYITEWLSNPDGSFTQNNANAGTGAADNGWQVVGSGDFNGDGRVDLLFRNTTSGYVTEWLGTSTGGFTDNSAHAGTGAADNSWQIASTGDFNGDGITDILWRNSTTGYLTEWLGTSNGSFTDNSAHAGTGAADNSWQVAGTGDFNGDGIDDILWRNTTTGYVTEWLGTSNGSFSDNVTHAGTGAADNSWKIAGVGDFNGDGTSDILWRNATSGYVTEWLGSTTGAFSDNSAHAGNGAADNSWQVVSIGDFNGDAVDDVLWRNTTTGYVTDWLGSPTGAFTDNSAHAGTGAADTSWHVQDTFF